VSAVIPPDLLTVEVTDDDILRGERCNALDCAIACAARRILWVNAAQAECDVLTVQYRGDNGLSEIALYELPEVANVFIQDYDEGAIVEPFTFTAKRVGT
jgi:hypothetical protein